MDKRFKNMIFIFLGVIIILPFILNFLVLITNFIPSAGDNPSMFQSLTGYFGGAIGGLATLITIYFTIIRVKEDHRPLLYFNDFSTYYYLNLFGICNYFLDKDCKTDDDVNEAEKSFSLELNNVGLYPALNLKVSITNLEDFLNSVKLLKVSEEDYNNIYNSYSKDNKDYFKKSLIKQGDNVILPPPEPWLEGFLCNLLYCYKKNIEMKNPINNNYAVNGRFKLFDIKIEYKDVDNYSYEDINSLYIKINSTIQLTSKLTHFEPWNIVFEFERVSRRLSEI